MSRLPQPGADSGTWGTILNDFLDVAHNPDGTLKANGIIASKADDNAVVHNSGAENIAGTKTFLASPILPTPTAPTQATNKAYVDNTVSAGAPDASPTTKGIVQLTGDLGGTATAPTVPGLAGKEATIVAGTTSQYYRGDKSWQTLDKTAVGLANVDNTSDINKPVSTATQAALNLKAPLASPTFTGTVTVPTPSNGTDAATKIYVDSQITSGTTPDATTTTKGKLQLAGDLGGTASTPTVPTAVKKGDLVYDVIDYGADPTGAVDSTSAFQSALNLCDGKGGIVFVRAGTYLVGALTIYSNTVLRGAGIGSVLKLKNGTNGIMLSTRDTIAAPTVYPHDHIIEDIKFDLNRTNNTTARAVEGYRVRNLIVQRCLFTNFNNQCVRVYGDSQYSIQARIINNQFDQADTTNGVGIAIDAGAFDSCIEANDIGRAYRGITLSNGGYGNHKLANNWTWGNMNAGVYVYQSHGNQFSSHTSESNFGDGIVFDGSNDNVMMGGRVSDNSFVDTDNTFGYGAGFGTANVASGVKAINGSVGLKCNGTLFVNPRTAQKYGIYASDASTTVYQINCTFTGQGTAPTATASGAVIQTFTASDSIVFSTASVSGNLAVGPGATLTEERLTIDGNIKIKGGQTIRLENPSFDSTLVASNTGASGQSLLNVTSGIGFAGQLIGGIDAMTYASVISLPINAALLHKTTTVNATGNATINASGGGSAGQVMYIMITNDATSGKTITFGTNFKPNGTLVGTTSKTAMLTFVSDGVNLYETSRVTGL